MDQQVPGQATDSDGQIRAGIQAEMQPQVRAGGTGIYSFISLTIHFNFIANTINYVADRLQRPLLLSLGEQGESAGSQ